MKRQKSALPGTNGKRQTVPMRKCNRSPHPASGRHVRKYRSQAANPPFCGAMKSHPAQRNETTGRSGTEKRAYRGRVPPGRQETVSPEDDGTTTSKCTAGSDGFAQDRIRRRPTHRFRRSKSRLRDIHSDKALNRKYTRRAGRTNRPGPAETNGPVPVKTEGVHPSARVDACEPQPPDRISARVFPGRGFGQRDPLPGTRNRRRADRNAGRQPGFGSLPTARTLRPTIPSIPSKAGRP